MPVQPRIRVEGYREFQRAVSRSVDRDLGKRIGQVHKQVGQFVISRLQPQPVPESVGAGAGAKVRPSATRREVILRVGYSGRSNPPVQQWGKRPIAAFQRRPKRPHIIGTALRHQDRIEDMLLDGIEKALKPPFN